MHASRSSSSSSTARPSAARTAPRAPVVLVDTTPPPPQPLLLPHHHRSAAAALLAAAHLASCCCVAAAPISTAATLTTAPPPPLPSASPSDAVVRRLPPPPPPPRPLLSSSSPTLPSAPPLLGPSTLPNGLRLFLIEDHEAPLVRGTLLIKGGARAVPNQKLGLGAITALSQRTGGSIHTPTPKLDDALADLAADIEVNAGPLAFSFDFGCLSSDAPRVLALVSELAREPLFPEDRVAAARQQILSSLEHADDDAGGVARRRLLEILYGKDSLYARHPTTKTAGSVTRTDVAAFAKRWQRPDAAVLGVTGDFDAAEMRALVEQAFGDWKPAPGEPVEPPVAPSSRPPRLPSNEEELLLLAGGGGGGGGGSSSSPQQQQQQQQPLVLLLNRPGLQQATVLLGEPGLSIADPDAPSLDVLASVFNSFGGALFDAVRSREGLAYSVAASWDTPSDHRGIFLASADTSRPADLLIELRRALGQAVVASGKGGSGSGGVSSEAVARALDQALEQYAFSVGGSSSRLARALSYDVLGLPQDFAQQYRDKLAAVTRESVVEAARRWLHPDSQAGQVAVVAADAAAVRPELEAAGFRVAVLPMMTQQAGES